MIQEAYVYGISARAMDDLVLAMGSTGISKSQVSRLCEEIDEGRRPSDPVDRERMALAIGFEPVVSRWLAYGSTQPI